MALIYAKSELCAVYEPAKNEKYARSVMKHLDVEFWTPITIYEDNPATIAISKNDQVRRRLRHVVLRNFAILEWAKNRGIILKSYQAQTIMRAS